LCAIDAREGHHVATANIPGAFMQTYMDQTIYIKIVRVMADLLIKIDPDRYLKHAYKNQGGMTVMYVAASQESTVWNSDHISPSYSGKTCHQP
jgi:hypothetical protein